MASQRFSGGRLGGMSLPRQRVNSASIRSSVARSFLAAGVALAAVAAALSVGENGCAADDLKERFLKEARQAWKDLSRLRFDYGYRCTTHLIHGDHDNGGTFRITVGRGCRMSQGQYPVGHPRYPNGLQVVKAFNPRYQFSISRPISGAGWHIDEVVMGPPPDWFDSLEKYTYSGVLDVGETPESRLTQQKRLSSILKSLSAMKALDFCADTLAIHAPGGGTNLFDAEGFEVLSAEPEVVAGRELVKVDVAWRVAGTPLEAKLWCDVPLHWAVVRYELSGSYPPGGPPMSVSFEYTADEKAGFPIVRRCERRWAGTPDHEQAEFEEVSSSPVPPREFTLSAFGLPEPPEASGGWPWTYLVVAVLGLLIIAFLLWRRRGVSRTSP